MDVHVNFTYVLVGFVLIALGIFAHRYFKKTSLVGSTTGSQAMRIGFDLSEYATTEPVKSKPRRAKQPKVKIKQPKVNIQPQAQPLAAASIKAPLDTTVELDSNGPATKQKRASWTNALMARFSKKQKQTTNNAVVFTSPDIDLVPQTIVTTTAAIDADAPAEPIVAPRQAAIAARVQAVPTRKSPLRFTPAAAAETSSSLAAMVADNQEDLVIPPAAAPHSDYKHGVLVPEPDQEVPFDEQVKPTTRADVHTAVISLDDDDDEPINFSGTSLLDRAERERLLAEMEADLAKADIEDEEEEEDAVEFVPLATTAATPGVAAAQAPVSQPGAMIETFRWTTFMGNDAQGLGYAERSNLVRLLRDMHDIATCLPILMDAFEEEKEDGLRPSVVEAIVHSYSNEALREFFEYCAEHGCESEKTLGIKALQSLSLS